MGVNVLTPRTSATAAATSCLRWRQQSSNHLLVVAVLMLVFVDVVRTQLCGADQFYDGVVRSCAMCSDVCNIRLAPDSLYYCQQICPEFYSRMLAELSTRPSTTPTTTTTSSSPFFPAVFHSQHLQPNSASWVYNPLVWTTIVSLTIAIIATVVIVPLLICIRRHTSRPQPYVVVDTESQTSSCSGSNSGSKPNTPTCIVHVPDWDRGSAKSSGGKPLLFVAPSDESV